MTRFNIQSKATGDVIVTADSLKEAEKLAEAYENNHFDEAIILDGEGNLVQDWYDFVYEIVLHSDSGCVKMDLYDAHLTLDEYKNEEIEIPAGLTAEDFQLIWNDAIVDLDRQIVIPEEPEAEQHDPMMEKLQIALDAAVMDRDDFYAQYAALVKDGSRPDRAHRMYIRYREAQGYLEGLTNGIFVAGYGIVNHVDSTKMTVTR